MSTGSKNQVLCLRRAFNITEILHEYSAVIIHYWKYDDRIGVCKNKLYQSLKY